MIADDDPVIRSVVIEQLRHEFDCVGEAADAAEAITVVAEQNPDVAILDVNMPAGGAGHATRQICEQSPGTAIVILSIDETWADLIELLNAGAMTYLRKGVDEPTLVHDLKAAIEAHRRCAHRASTATNGHSAAVPAAFAGDV
ncbi:MAG: response regulator transcription factor [Solirubrobacteraceae bacterium]